MGPRCWKGKGEKYGSLGKLVKWDKWDKLWKRRAPGAPGPCEFFTVTVFVIVIHI